MAAALATLWLWRMKERGRVLDAWQQAHERAAAAERAFDLVNESVEQHAALSWLIQGMDQLVRTPDATLDYLLSRCGPWEHEASVLAAVVAEASGYVRSAQAEIMDSARGRPLAADWDEFRNTHGIPVTTPLQEMVYERVYLRLMVEHRANAVQAGSGVRTGAEPDQAERPAPRHSLVVTSAEAQRLEAERAGIIQQLFEAAMAQESAQAQLGRATMGWSAKWYLIVTAYVSLIGIVMPSIVLTTAPTALKAELRWLLLVAFFTVVIAVVSTFAVTIRARGKGKLSRKKR
jgi:hypothetical protein